MQQQIQNLKDSELTQVLADGFALLYHRKPKFPITYLAHYLKNHQYSKGEKEKIPTKVSNNKKLNDEMLKKQQESRASLKIKEQQKIKHDTQEKEFLDKIANTEYHEDMLDYFCDWIQSRFKLTGVYIGELKSKKKNVNLAQDDSEEAHFDQQAPKLIYFEHCSSSHKDIMLNKTLPVQSVFGKLLTEGGAEGGEEPPAEGQQGVVKQAVPKDEIYYPSVVDKSELHFFKFPKLGSFFGIGAKLNSYLSNKLFDQNSLRVSTYQKQHDEYQKLRQQREAKFREAFDEKTNSGADQQELEAMQKQFEKQQAQFEKPKLKQFDAIKRQFVFGFDTLGQDRGINKTDQQKIKEYVLHLKKCWENAQIQGLKTDIDRHLKLADKIQAPHQETFLKMIAEEDKQVLAHEQVEKNKGNEKLMELEMDSVRADKIKQYLGDEKYEPFLEQILNAKVLKFQQVVKYWLLFTGKKKEQINFPGTNVLDYRKIKNLLSKDEFVSKMNQYVSRGSKPQAKVENYAKWERLERNLQKIEIPNVAAYNIYLAFVLRYLQLIAKVRKADRQKRITTMQQQRKARTGRRKQNERKTKQKEAKLASLVAEAEQKQEQFDQEAWLAQYNEAQENQLVDVGPEILDQIDRDLENGQEIFPEIEEPAEGENQPPAQ